MMMCGRSDNQSKTLRFFHWMLLAVLGSACLVPNELHLAADKGVDGVGGVGGSAAGAAGSGQNAGGVGSGGQSGSGGQGATATGGSAGTQSMGTAHVRLGNFDPSSSAVDLCIKNHLGEYESLLSKMVSIGVQNNQVSGYVEIPAGEQELVIAKNASNCSLEQYPVAQSTFADGTRWTVTKIGASELAGTSVQIVALEDRQSTGPDSVGLRVVGPWTNVRAFDVWTYLGWLDEPPQSTNLLPLFLRVGGAKVTATSTDLQLTLDDLGYIDLPMALNNSFAVELRNCDKVEPSVTVLDLLPLGAGKLGDSISLFLGPQTSESFSIVSCVDTLVTESSGLSRCRLATQVPPDAAPGSVVDGAIPTERGSLRVANMSPAQPSVGVCVRPKTGNWLSGETQVWTDNLSFAAMFGNRVLNPGAYSIAVVPAGLGCDQPPINESDIIVEPEDSLTVVFAQPTVSSSDWYTLQNHDLSPSNQQTRFRFVNTFTFLDAPGIGSLAIRSELDPASQLEFFAALGESTSDEISISGNVPFTFDSGYALFSLEPPTRMLLAGAVPTCSSEATSTQYNGHSYTLFGVGEVGAAPASPPSLVVCEEDSAPPAAVMSCTIVDFSSGTW